MHVNWISMVVLLAAIALVVAQMGRLRFGIRSAIFLLCCATLVTAVAAPESWVRPDLAAVSRERPTAEPSAHGDPQSQDGWSYVGSQACRSCHPSHYDTWHSSFHRTMTQVATPESVLAPFDGRILKLGGNAISPCYTHGDASRGIMTCLSCHQMHQTPGDERSRSDWTDDQLLPAMRGNAACTQCHPQFADSGAVAAHSHHPAGSDGSTCYNCHLPYSTFGLLKAIRSHTIESRFRKSIRLPPPR